MNNLEKKIVCYLNRCQNGYVDDFSAAISSILFLLVTWTVGVIAILLLDPLVGVAIATGLAIVFLLNLVVVEIILKKGAKIFSLERLRPYQAHPKEIHPIGKNFSDSSFPSSHTASITGGLFVLVYFYPNFLLAALGILALMSWSRLHNGMHYPTDILAGVILGLGYGFVALEMLNRLLQ